MESTPCDPLQKNTEQCRVFRSEGRCYEDRHHLFFPRGVYRKAIDKAFRELPENIVDTCRDAHNEEHAKGVIPMKPDIDTMRQALGYEEHIDDWTA